MKKRIYAGVGASAGSRLSCWPSTVGAAIAHSAAPRRCRRRRARRSRTPSGQYLIASDLPLQGSGRTQTIQMTKAIAYILKQHGWKAGKYTLAYQSCDDSTAQAGKWDSGKCSANANAYAQNSSVVRRDRDVQLRLLPRSSSRSSTGPRTARSRWSARRTRTSA